jgi:hypothetical protein
MFDELNAVVNDLMEAFFSPFTKVLFGKNQQVFDDITTTYGLIPDHAQELDDRVGLIPRKRGRILDDLET